MSTPFAQACVDLGQCVVLFNLELYDCYTQFKVDRLVEQTMRPVVYGGIGGGRGIILRAHLAKVLRKLVV